MDGMIGIRGEFLIVLMAENLRGVALVKFPQCFGPTFHTSHGLQARHGHHAIGSCELFRMLFDPFWLQTSGENLGFLKIWRHFMASKKPNRKSGYHQHQPPTNHHHWFRNLSTTSSHPREFKSSGETRIHSPPLLPNVAVPLLPGAQPLHRHPPQRSAVEKTPSWNWFFKQSGEVKNCVYVIFVDWNLEVCKFYYIFSGWF